MALLLSLFHTLAVLPPPLRESSMAQEPGSRQAMSPDLYQSHSKFAVAGHTVQSPAGDVLSVPGPQPSKEAFLLPPTLYSCPMASSAVPAPGIGAQRQLLRESWAQ